MQRIAVMLALAIGIHVQAADEHLVCFSNDGVFHYKHDCAVREGRYSAVTPAEKPRRLLWASRAQNAVAIGELAPGATALSGVVDTNCCTISLPESVVAPDGEDGTVTLTAKTGGTWAFTLDSWWFRAGRLNIAVPRDRYERIRVTSAGKTLLDTAGPDFTQRTNAALILTGRAVGKDTTTPADFAQLTVECRRVVCTADAEGRFRCPLREVPRAVCIEHGELGRGRIEIEGRTGAVDLKTVALQPGAAIRVVRPLHVELPPGTKVSLRQGEREIRAPQAFATRWRSSAWTQGNTMSSWPAPSRCSGSASPSR